MTNVTGSATRAHCQGDASGQLWRTARKIGQCHRYRRVGAPPEPTQPCHVQPVPQRPSGEDGGEHDRRAQQRVAGEAAAVEPTGALIERPPPPQLHGERHRTDHGDRASHCSAERQAATQRRVTDERCEHHADQELRCPGRRAEVDLVVAQRHGQRHQRQPRGQGGEHPGDDQGPPTAALPSRPAPAGAAPGTAAPRATGSRSAAPATARRTLRRSWSPRR